MQAVKTICDECGAEKREANHWFQARLFTHTAGVSVVFEKWFETGQPTERVDLCGAECAAKVLQRWLSTGKLREGE